MNAAMSSVASRERREYFLADQAEQRREQRNKRKNKRQQSFHVKEVTAKPNFALNCWLFLEHPSSSPYARMWSVVVTFTILLSSTTFVAGTLPQYHVQGPHTAMFDGVEYYSIAVFTIEYVGRWIFFPVNEMKASDSKTVLEKHDPTDGSLPSVTTLQYAGVWFMSRLRFMRRMMNFIDLLAVLPFYIELVFAALAVGGKADAGGLAVVRVVRITRIFRLLKLGKNNDGMEILVQTMQASYSFLVSVLFLMLIITVLYASIVFYFETAQSSCVSAWECNGGEMEGADCTVLWDYFGHEGLETTRIEQMALQEKARISLFTGNPRPVVPSGALIPARSKANNSTCGPNSECQIVGNICYNEYGGTTNYNSIPNSMWWCLVTMCCVGFGDMAPVTVGGKILGVMTALTGVIVLAMPTTVIGTNFSEIYESYYARKREEATDDAETFQSTDESSGLSDELKGTNSKHLNRLIVKKQLAAQAKDQGIPQDVINLAFMSGDAVRSEREKAVFETISSFKREITSEISWAELAHNVRIAGIARVHSIIQEKASQPPDVDER